MFSSFDRMRRNRAAKERAGGSFPPPFIPIADSLERARARIGDAADAHYEAGRELGLFEAVSMARAAAT